MRRALSLAVALATGCGARTELDDGSVEVTPVLSSPLLCARWTVGPAAELALLGAAVHPARPEAIAYGFGPTSLELLVLSLAEEVPRINARAPDRSQIFDLEAEGDGYAVSRDGVVTLVGRDLVEIGIEPGLPLAAASWFNPFDPRFVEVAPFTSTVLPPPVTVLIWSRRLRRVVGSYLSFTGKATLYAPGVGVIAALDATCVTSEIEPTDRACSAPIALAPSARVSAESPDRTATGIVLAYSHSDTEHGGLARARVVDGVPQAIEPLDGTEHEHLAALATHDSDAVVLTRDGALLVAPLDGRAPYSFSAADEITDARPMLHGRVVVQPHAAHGLLVYTFREVETGEAISRTRILRCEP